MLPHEDRSQAIEHFRRTALDQGLTLGEDRLSVAVRTHEALRANLERLRHTPLEFVGNVIEPSSATQWLEEEGLRT